MTTATISQFTTLSLVAYFSALNIKQRRAPDSEQLHGPHLTPTQSAWNALFSYYKWHNDTKKRLWNIYNALYNVSLVGNNLAYG